LGATAVGTAALGVGVAGAAGPSQGLNEQPSSPPTNRRLRATSSAALVRVCVLLFNFRLHEAILDQSFLIGAYSIAERYEDLMKKLSGCS
jgi:hypothetical protein